MEIINSLILIINYFYQLCKLLNIDNNIDNNNDNNKLTSQSFEFCLENY